MAATGADGQQGLSWAAQTSIETNSIKLWDQIEDNYFSQVHTVRVEEDRKINARFQNDMDKLDKERLSLHERRLLILKKMDELNKELQSVNDQTALAEEKARELTQTIKDTRLTIANARAHDDETKRQWLSFNRQNEIDKANMAAMNAMNGANNGTESTVSSRESPVRTIEKPAENLERPVEIVEATTAAVEMRSEIEQRAVSRAPELEVAPAVDNDDGDDKMDIDPPVELESHAETGKAAEASHGADAQEQTSAKDDTNIPNGDDVPNGTNTPNGGDVQHDNPAQNGVVIENDTSDQNGVAVQNDAAPNGVAAQDDTAPNGVAVQGGPDPVNDAAQTGPDLDKVAAQNVPGRDNSAVQNAADVNGGLDGHDDTDEHGDAMDIESESGVDVIGGPTETIRQDTESSSELTSAHSTPIPEPPGFDLRREEESKLASPAEEGYDAVEVYDGAGELIGKVRPINLDNHWVNRVKELPIKRKVEIRAGRKFTIENLESIYEPSDAKGAKWLSCYVQATGEIQGTPCHTCTKPAGVFKQCVILGGDDFPRCGNCEWNRQGCHGASLLPKSRSSMGADVETPTRAEKPKAVQVTTGGFTPVNNSATGQNARSPVEEEVQGKPAVLKPAKTGRKSLPSGSTQKSKGKVVTPAATTPMTGSPAPDTEHTLDDLGEINKSVIEFQDDGVVFTHPKFMEGVPLAKIGPDHPYWEKDWQPLEGQISGQLKKWQEKLEQHRASGTAQSSKFLANRQVNRGNAILDFLEKGEIHPYQIVGKEYINKHLASYDTVFRMVQVLSELRKFTIDITPVEWLRHRLYEIWQEQGSEFNLGKTVHDLYHDEKVLALRAKSGFGNIGRPSGYRMEKGEPAKRTPRSGKRKELHATPKSTPQQRKVSVAEPSTAAPTPEPAKEDVVSPTLPARPRSSSHRKSRGASAEQQLQHHIQREEVKAAHASPRETKKQRLQLELTTEAEDLEYNGYTSSDSFSHDHVMHVDWRVYQVKHRKISTNTLVTQYWHWVDRAEGGNEENMFEHQVLKDVLVNKVTWGVYKEPYDFHLRLSEVTEVTYATQSMKIIIGTKEIEGVVWRGDLLVFFKRDRTKRRFLSFLKRKGIKLIKESKESVEQAWEEMDSDMLPHYDSD